jgi:tripartite-type tricarboxylate transporter receptor subunit TctC
MQHVPYRGMPQALTDVLAGQIDCAFADTSSAQGLLQDGKLRALAVTSAARLDVLPDTPTVGDFVPGYEASGFAGIGAPRGTPADIIELLNKELNAGLADSKVKARIVELGGTVLGGSPAEFGTILSEAIEKWTTVIKFAGIKVE